MNTVGIVPVTVIVPCFRSFKTVDRAAESVLAQTLRPKELIFVDDCSDDQGKTIDLLTDIQRRYNHLIDIRVLSTSHNKGAGGARNLGWKNATQEYIAFLDSDDVWHPKKMEIQTEWMFQNKEVMLSCHDLCVLSLGDLPSFKAQDIAVNKLSIPVKKINRASLLFRNSVYTSTVLIRRECIEKFSNFSRMAEDYELWLRLILNGEKIVRVNIRLACSLKYLFGEAGLTGNLFLMHDGVIACFRRLLAEGLIKHHEFLLSVVWERLKLTRRLLICAFRSKR